MSKYFSLSTQQKNIWNTEMFYSGTDMHNIGGYLLINNHFNVKLLEKSANLFVQKNDIVRSHFIIEDGEPKQYITEFKPFHINVKNLNNIDELVKNTQKIVHTPMEILNSNLYKFQIFRLPNGTGGIIPVFHHLISDAWSLGLFINEIMDIYSSFCENNHIELELPQYEDYISSSEDYLNSKKFKKDKEYWDSAFSTSPDLTFISKDKTLHNVSGLREVCEIDNTLFDKIQDYCTNNHCSTYTFFMAIFSLYLAKINSSNSSIIGTPVLNRGNFKEKQTMGMFVSTVPFRTEINYDMNFSNFVKEVGLNQTAIFRHQKYPYLTLLEDIKNKYNLNDNLFDFVLSYQNVRDNKNSCSIPFTSFWCPTQSVATPIEAHFYDMDDSGKPSIYYNYQTEKFSRNDVLNIHNRIMNMVSYALEDNILKDIPVITNEEKTLIDEYNNTYSHYNKNKSIVSMFEDQVKKNPNKQCVIFENKSITYKELDSKSNQLAHMLIESGIKHNDIIGIMLNRSYNLHIAMLGIIKAGASYLLIDPNLPEERIKYMLSNSSVSTVITDMYINYNSINMSLIDGYKDSLPKVKSSNDERFCIIYTSGSTGTPKGVELRKLGLINMVHSYRELLNIDECNVFLSTSTVAFDMFMAENFIAMLTGKTIVLANEEEQKNPNYTCKLIKENKVDYILSTPSKISLLLADKKCLESVKLIQLGGEVFKPNLYSELRKVTKARIYNSYGPCECTGCTTNKLVVDPSDVSIGTPICNIKLSIQNHIGNILPIDVPGELIIEGDNVGIGYINKYQFNGVYRTGDIAMLSHSGDLVYFGRKDNQIKLHGLRIELDEITNKIMKMNGIRNAITIIKKVNNNDSICSYIIASNNITDVEVKQYLTGVLPSYMVPSHIMFVKEFSITPNGKIDTNALPNIEVKKSKYVAPTTNTEIVLNEIWSDILKIDNISINDNFFDLGGDSLCSIKLVSQIYNKFNINIQIKDVFDFPTIFELGKKVDTLEQSSNLKINKHETKDFYPVTSMQRGIFYATQMDNNSLSYNTPFSITFDKIPDINKLEKSLETIINSHDSFRTYFVLQDNDVVQKVLPKVDFKLKVLHHYNNNFLSKFDLSIAPLIHAELNIVNDKAILLLDIHHIVCDGTSIHILSKELCDLYNGEKIRPSDFEYIDFSVNQVLNEDDQKFWISKFKNEVPMLNMPTVFERSSEVLKSGDNVFTEINNIEKINAICKQLQITPFMFFLSCYYILLYKYTMQNDLVVGTPVDCRNTDEFYDVIGMFVNTICLRQSIQSSNTFSEFVNIVKENCLNSFTHKAFPYEELVKELKIPRISSRNPIFDVMFIYESQGLPELDFKDISVNVKAINNPTSKFDFSLEVTPSDSSYNIRLEYCTSLYNKEFMGSLLKCYKNIINIVSDDLDIQISKIKMVKDIYSILNQNQLDVPSDLRIIDLFEKQVLKSPNKIALVFGDKKFTYKELDERVNSLANYIMSSPAYKTVMKQQYKTIGIMMNRRAELIISMLAILRVGAGYLPIDPTYPEDRVNYIINDSNVKLIIIEDGINCSIDSISVDNEKINQSADHIDIKKKTDDIAYIIYTSGSTGNPKGVIIKESNVVNFIYSMKNLLPIYNKNIVSITTMCFDIFVLESLLPVCSGLKIVLASNEEQNNPQLLNKLCITNKVDMIQTTPSKFNFLISDDDNLDFIKNMKLILLGGEPLNIKLLNRIKSLTSSIIYNMYGPTETTVWSTLKNLTHKNSVTIGTPINNTQVYVLDNDLNILPKNVPGKLFIGGEGVSSGYLNMPELTAQKFIDYNGSVIYDTGDLAKYNFKNELECLGRTDFQVKVRGLRIELGEIENSILDFPKITEAVVTVKNINNRDVLCGYFVAKNSISTSLLRNSLYKKLPSYMIPTYLMQVSSFNHTPNGKIDRKNLPDPHIESKNIISPKTTLQKKLLINWKEILSIDEISINDNFFEIGGDSLSALRLQLELRKNNINVSYGDLFKNSTIEKLSYFIEKNSKSSEIPLYKSRDFRLANRSLRKNNLRKRININQNTIKDVLLVGATGFLGIHVLSELLKEDNIKIYCIVRDDPSTSAESKLKNKFKYYFGSDLENLFGKRLFVISGDISQTNFGLNIDQYRLLASKVRNVINCAANVKHYGQYEDFEKVNVTGVKNIIDFCEEFGQTFFHTSTLSVSGNTIVDLPSSFNPNKKVYFSENKLFIHQALDNVYVRSKFEAEKYMLEELANKKLRGIILRIGNITNRTFDGKFQENSSENAFLNRLKAFIYLNMIPESIANNYIEFSPVDSIAQSVVESIRYFSNSMTVLHLYNSNHIKIRDLIDYLNECGVKIKIVDDKTFENTLTKVLYSSSDFDKVSILLNDLDDENRLVYKTNLITTNDFTLKFFNMIDFKWPIIDKDYIKRIVDNL
ncbi:MAG: amino acid adenylation domain-containing protein [Clostridia bacterium]|nr:amino acid adenylation domain-containing protein [Clostridia bacterium]